MQRRHRQIPTVARAFVRSRLTPRTPHLRQCRRPRLQLMSTRWFTTVLAGERYSLYKSTLAHGVDRDPVKAYPGRPPKAATIQTRPITAQSKLGAAS